ncbi:sensor histidine kinase [Solicola gregarius]|uniref:Signal transduction histidine-protein kinase/phosphatase MprB n=1 Tax=Solicola gregarius TaxID=2908642 RepID=A0AA46TFP3_9ACTN|nr:HAMP domain-containing sensor histidine kinase [Solicola gregarius]UYM03962.1 HAMP domain-containing histidine kinase [Solicola gregarius]
MRRRLVVVAGVLLSLLLVALMAPLVSAYAEDRTQDSFTARLTDVTRFAVLAQESLETGRFGRLTADLRRYVEVYGGEVLVTDANRQVVAASQVTIDVDEGRVADVLDRALSGSGSPQPETVWPWHGPSFVVGSPVGRDAHVLGAVVMIAPTDSIRSAVSTRLAWLAIAGLAVLAVAAGGLVGPFVRWILRPVGDLDVAARRLAHGDLGTRVPSTTGPPELRHLARSFNQMADNVETSQRQQRELIADASHQLGNPLTALRLRVENLRADPSDGDEAEMAIEETDRLNSIVESLLDLSQVGARQVTPEPVDVAGRTRHRCEMWAPAIDGLALDAPRECFAYTTADTVDLVLDALLDNAAKFAPDSPVDVAVRTIGDEVVVAVRDRGPGLMPDDVGKVGARFFRGRTHQNVAGTGLGLAIVRARVEDVGGRFDVSSPDGGGLEVQVAFKRRAAAPGSTAAPPGAGRADS